MNKKEKKRSLVYKIIFCHKVFFLVHLQVLNSTIVCTVLSFFVLPIESVTQDTKLTNLETEVVNPFLPLNNIEKKLHTWKINRSFNLKPCQPKVVAYDRLYCCPVVNRSKNNPS